VTIVTEVFADSAEYRPTRRALGDNTVHKIANINLTPLENNLSVWRKIVAIVVLALALVGGPAVAMKVHSHQAIACTHNDGC
jgi:hypothetical protein